MIRAYYRLAKPGIIYGNAITASAAYLFGADGDISYPRLSALIVGLSLSMAGACVVNNILDRDIDANMSRTRERALVTGAIKVRSAAAYAAALAVLGFGTLLAFTNTATFLVTAFGTFAYLALYTPAKRVTRHSTIIGSLAGAVPPVAGYAAATGTLDGIAILLFLVLVTWQMAHFFAIAIFRKEDYAQAKLPIMSVDAGVGRTKALLIVYACLFSYATFLLGVYAHLGRTYSIPVLAASLLWVVFGFAGIFAHDERRWARRMFFYSIFLIFLFSVAIALSAAFS